MNVQELIDRLKNYDPNMPVVKNPTFNRNVLYYEVLDENLEIRFAEMFKSIKGKMWVDMTDFKDPSDSKVLVI